MISRSSRVTVRIMKSQSQRAIVATVSLMIGSPLRVMAIWYMRTMAAIPDTMAEKRKMIGISAVDHQGLALMAPKRKPT